MKTPKHLPRVDPWIRKVNVSAHGHIYLDHSIEARTSLEDEDRILPKLLNLKTVSPMLSHKEHTPTPRHLISRDESICDVSLANHGHIRLSHVFKPCEMSTGLEMLDMVSSEKYVDRTTSKRRSSNVTKALRRFLPTRSFTRMQECGRRLAVRTILRRFEEFENELLSLAWTRWCSFKKTEEVSKEVEEKYIEEKYTLYDNIRWKDENRRSQEEKKEVVRYNETRTTQKKKSKEVYYYNAPERMYEFVYGPFEETYMRHWIERDFLPGWRVKDWKRRVRIRVETFDSAHVVTWNELTKRMKLVNLTRPSDISFISGCSVPHKSEIVRLHERYSTANIRAKVLEQKRQGRDEVNVFEKKRKPIVTVGCAYSRRPRVFVVSPIVNRIKNYVMVWMTPLQVC